MSPCVRAAAALDGEFVALGEDGRPTSTGSAGGCCTVLKTPSGCPDLPKAQQSSSCQATWEPERADLAKLRTEIFARPLRLALATWPG